MMQRHCNLRILDWLSRVLFLGADRLYRRKLKLHFTARAVANELSAQDKRLEVICIVYNHIGICRKHNLSRLLYMFIT